MNAYPGLRRTVYRHLASGDNWNKMLYELMKLPHHKENVNISWMYELLKLQTKGARSLCFLNTIQDLVTPEQFIQCCLNINFDLMAGEVQNPTKYTFEPDFITERVTATERLDAYLERNPELGKDIQRSMNRNWRNVFYKLPKLFSTTWCDDIEYEAATPGAQGALFMQRISKLYSVKELETACRGANIDAVADLLVH